MRFTSVAFVLCMSVGSYAMAMPGEASNAVSHVAQAAQGCGAAGSCKGVGGGALCNNRCKECTNNQGKRYRGGSCGGLLLQ
ncbi:unnamed protein product [Clonostachys solani]|uniref:Uncharacterized protein n=1 Tax=Clonostachys solani TaxID=160281 RepID=A0A9N9YTC6_9HYPO|nr:unnamed protein product [Clonostachys solani]